MGFGTWMAELSFEIYAYLHQADSAAQIAVCLVYQPKVPA